MVAETFLPQMNGVVGSVLQMLAHLERRGHEVLVVAPKGPSEPEPSRLHGARLASLRSVPAPGYPEVRLTLVSALEIEGVLRDFAPDVVHLASPFVLGWQALRAARSLGIPTVAVYQTDIPGYAARYGLPGLQASLERHLARLHNAATLTLAPSRASIAALESLGVARVRGWARGVDGERFHPSRRSAEWRARLAPNGETLVGFVGRLAPEKQVEDLAVLRDVPGVRVVVIGDGPSRTALERSLPGAAFLGFLAGDALAEALASLDVFVHPGERETFCQTIQEALASGVPVVATGRGGPLDLVESSRNGWLYTPGDLDDLRDRVRDLVGDPAKRTAFAAAARESVAHRTWERLGDELLGHYRDAIRTVALPNAALAITGPIPGVATGAATTRWRRYVAVGDSLTEGLCDDSRQAPGAYRGWADRLATYLASGDGEPLRYANLGVRGRRVADVVDEQIPAAIALGADLVTILVGANDLVLPRAKPEALAAKLLHGVDVLRESGADVLLVAPFAPRRWWLRPVVARFERFRAVLERAAPMLGAIVLDFQDDPACRERRAWSEDRVHLSSHGHRVLSYRAAEALGLADAAAVGALDLALHDGEPIFRDSRIPTAVWLWKHARPWAMRRLRNRTAGDGLVAKRPELVAVAPHPRIRSLVG